MAPLAEVAGIAGPHLPQGDRPGAPDVGRLRAENESLRAQLTASETVAHEREQRIEDLLAALRGLPQAWMDYMERTGRPIIPGDGLDSKDPGHRMGHVRDFFNCVKSLFSGV